MFGDFVSPLNASRGLLAIAEFLAWPYLKRFYHFSQRWRWTTDRMKISTFLRGHKTGSRKNVDAEIPFVLINVCVCVCRFRWLTRRSLYFSLVFRDVQKFTRRRNSLVSKLVPFKRARPFVLIRAYFLSAQHRLVISEPPPGGETVDFMTVGRPFNRISVCPQWYVMDVVIIFTGLWLDCVSVGGRSEVKAPEAGLD